MSMQRKRQSAGHDKRPPYPRYRVHQIEENVKMALKGNFLIDPAALMQKQKILEELKAGRKFKAEIMRKFFDAQELNDLTAYYGSVITP